MQASNIEGKNATGVGEWYHTPPRRVCNVPGLYAPYLALELALRLATEAIKDTMAPNGLVPSLLLYGPLPRFPSQSKSPSQADHRSTVGAALSDTSQSACDTRVNRALRSHLPIPARLLIRPGRTFLVYLESSRLSKCAIWLPGSSINLF